MGPVPLVYRDVEDKEQNGEGTVPTEKFSGWGKAETEQPKGTTNV